MRLQTREDFEKLGNMIITVMIMAGIMLLLNVSCEWYGCNKFDSIAALLKSSFSTDMFCNGCVKARAFVLDQQLLTYGLLFTAIAGEFCHSSAMLEQSGFSH